MALRHGLGFDRSRTFASADVEDSGVKEGIL
jgi:hypothetical protein